MIHLLLASLFCDHMVLQRNQANPVWGWDRPRQEITLTVDEGPVTVAPLHIRTGDDGSWHAVLPPLPAGGPYRIRISDGTTQRTIHDVLVGEVWVASGQSNMERALKDSAGAAKTIATETTPEIREFKVERTTALEPAREVAGRWTLCTPATAGSFSAVATYFALELHRRLHVPIGIVNSTWGGTRIQAWASIPAQRAVSDVDAELAHIAALAPEMPKLEAAYDLKRRAWERANFATDTGIAPESAAWADPATNDADWKTLPVPAYWQHHGLKFNGAVWFRTHVTIPAAWAGHDLRLNLGPIDDFDTTYFNGIEVGHMGAEHDDAYEIPRHYVIPARLVKAGGATIAVRIFDRGGDGGFAGTDASMSLSPVGEKATALPLAGEWRYRVERSIPLVVSDWSTYPLPTYPQPQDRPAALFNGMIAPLIPYGIRGVIWYQGENNTDAPRHYHALFTAMIRDWRTRWGQGQFPFDFVQLANYKGGPGWPIIREQQAMTLAEPGTGMAVIIDIGDPDIIHPSDKRDVGHRLALLARSQVYGEPAIVTSGPTLKRVEIVGDCVKIHWVHAAGLRTRTGTPQVLGIQLAGADGRFFPATAKITDANTVAAVSPDVPAPIAVRYDFADNPDGNLENAAGLPAAPFRTDGF